MEEKTQKLDIKKLFMHYLSLQEDFVGMSSFLHPKMCAVLPISTSLSPKSKTNKPKKQARICAS